MLIYELIHSLYDQFVPTDAVRKNQMKEKIAMAYASSLHEAEKQLDLNKYALEYNKANKDLPDFKPEAIKPLTFKQKAIKFADSPFMMYIFGLLFVVLVPFINRLISPSSRDEDESGEDEGQSDLEMALEYIKHKKRMR